LASPDEQRRAFDATLSANSRRASGAIFPARYFPREVFGARVLATGSCADKLLVMNPPTLALGCARLLCVLMVAALALAGCARDGRRADAQSASFGKLAGRVTRGPMAPVSGPRIKSSPPASVSGVEIRIFNSKGAMVATARTDGDGFYRVALPPGNYRVERGAGFSGAARNLPAKVAISPGAETRLDIWVDTGIRAPGRPAAIP